MKNREIEIHFIFPKNIYNFRVVWWLGEGGVKRGGVKKSSQRAITIETLFHFRVENIFLEVLSMFIFHAKKQYRILCKSLIFVSCLVPRTI